MRQAERLDLTRTSRKQYFSYMEVSGRDCVATATGPEGPVRGAPVAGKDHRPLPEGAPIVLVIEDDPDVALAIVQCLAAHGYATLRGANGTEALELAPLHPLAMVLLDWRLPGTPKGAELVQRLRAECRYRLPVVVISADPAALSEARDAGVEDYLPKPFRLDDLVHVVDEHSR